MRNGHYKVYDEFVAGNPNFYFLFIPNIHSSSIFKCPFFIFSTIPIPDPFPMFIPCPFPNVNWYLFFYLFFMRALSYVFYIVAASSETTKLI